MSDNIKIFFFIDGPMSIFILYFSYFIDSLSKILWKKEKLIEP